MCGRIFSLLQQIYKLVSTGSIHPKWIALQKEFYPNEPTVYVKRLSQTSWTAQVLAGEATFKRLDVIPDGDNREQAVYAVYTCNV